jgi:hypothetical protein
VKKSVAILLVVSVVFTMALSACGVINDVTTVGNLGKDFMTAMKNGDAASSWDMLTPDVQAEVGDTASWEEFVKNEGFSDWTFTNTQVENNTGQIDGEATYGTDTYTLRLVFDKVDNSWLVSGINFTPK